MPSRRRPDPEPTLSIFPDQIHIGDRFTDAETGDAGSGVPAGHVQAGARGPRAHSTARQAGDLSREGVAGARKDHRPADDAGAGGADSPTPAPVEEDDIDALRREVRRLRGEVTRLEDDKRELKRRLGFMQRQVEELRAKGPRGISTS